MWYIEHMKLKLQSGQELELILVEGAFKGSVDLCIADSQGRAYAGGHILQIMTNGKLYRHWNLDRNTGIQVTYEDGYFRIEEGDGRDR